MVETLLNKLTYSQLFPGTMMNDLDASEQLIDAIHCARSNGARVRIRGGGSKRFLERSAPGVTLNSCAHRGIINLDTAGVSATVRSGTPLRELQAVIDAAGFMFAFRTAVLCCGGHCWRHGRRRPYRAAAPLGGRRCRSSAWRYSHRRPGQAADFRWHSYSRSIDSRHVG